MQGKYEGDCPDAQGNLLLQLFMNFCMKIFMLCDPVPTVKAAHTLYMIPGENQSCVLLYFELLYLCRDDIAPRTDGLNIPVRQRFSFEQSCGDRVKEVLVLRQNLLCALIAPLRLAGNRRFLLCFHGFGAFMVFSGLTAIQTGTAETHYHIVDMREGIQQI